jgi:hypothetical protein
MQRQRDEIPAMQRNRPRPMGIALRAAMQRMLVEEVLFGLIAIAANGEAAVADAVGIAANDRAEEGRIRLVAFQTVIAPRPMMLAVIPPPLMVKRRTGSPACVVPKTSPSFIAMPVNAS